ncbi:AAA family ATPase [Nordella sp. HKS 07]|uniref:AAA family ATPase n=1 Tax=Nordella sp. HKS 07 TaxID=2712222 RepID=UPI0013E19A66|nr:AAA family ATPase [Nordella sp. HKS 07]QIG52159.1 AAA family ATPase [Nordella sp. HKS 07]
MSQDSDRFFIITGGPGAGKTTLLDALAVRGHHHTVEAGRAIIQDQMAIDGPILPWRDPALFAEAMLVWDMRSYRIAETQPGTVFFDRGVPDMIGYLRLMGLPVPAHMMRAAAQFRYNRLVFVAPFWAEIFATDSERKQSPEEARRTCQALMGTYREFGFELALLPLASVDERVRFVLARAGLPV